MFTRTELVIAAMLLLGVLTAGGNGQSLNAGQRKDDVALEQQDRAIVMKITPVGYSRKANDYVEKLQFKAGETIRIARMMTNTTSKPLVTSTVDDLFYYRPRLLKDGQLVEYRKEIIPSLKSYDEYGLAATVVYRCIAVVLVPNKPSVDYIDLSYWYGSLEAGHYQLTLGRRFLHGVAQIQSNTVTFDVEPAI